MYDAKKSLPQVVKLAKAIKKAKPLIINDLALILI
jgi:hypothetical protein